ncbi:MAG: hypothetical protein J0I40_03800, partial [Cellulomonas sp.]|nr:hypothetical protein [Cellulomonas sp.]
LMLPLLFAVAESVARDNRAKLFRQYMALSPSFHDQSSLGDLMSRSTEDSVNVRNGVYWLMWSISIGLVTVLNVVVVMILLDKRLALVAALMLPLLFAVAESVARDNRAKLFRQYMALSPSFHDQSSLGDLMSRST